MAVLAPEYETTRFSSGSGVRGRPDLVPQAAGSATVYSTTLRNELRRGLDECVVEMADAEIVALADPPSAFRVFQPYAEEIATRSYHGGYPTPHLAVFANEDGSFGIVCRSGRARFVYEIIGDEVRRLSGSA